ncbi:ribonuclease H-like domain-containing protein [Candidatus Riflebacteria bacterium]
MIDGAFLHFPGIGPRRLHKLRQAGFLTWKSVLTSPDSLPFAGKMRDRFIAEVHRCQNAFEVNDINYLVKKILPREQWRILGRFFERASYFDIETTGFYPTDHISLIVCYHKGRFSCYLKDRNLEDFLDLLDEVQLLVSFNGSSFDIPRLLDTFHIPCLPCPHIDIRWLCYHARFRGGLKKIEQDLGIGRPGDLLGIDGLAAISLWNDWLLHKNRDSLNLLTRYCSADVFCLKILAQKILQQNECFVDVPERERVWDFLSNNRSCLSDTLISGQYGNNTDYIGR